MNRTSVTRRTIAAIIAMWVISSSGTINAQTAPGEANFAKLCTPCHTIGGGKRVGPDLKGIHDRRSEDWLLKWTTSSQGMVQSGDPDAVALFREYNIPMPDVTLPAQEIRDILAFIRAGREPVVVITARTATPEDIRKGREMFQGSMQFANGGPACGSCHHVTHDAVVGGGVLAKELTTSFTRLGMAGLRSIMVTPPYPVMQQAFEHRPLTEDELIALGGYLQNVSERPQLYDQPREDSLKLLVGGLGGLAILMGIYALAWRRRKIYPVNKKVFDRQVYSQ